MSAYYLKRPARLASLLAAIGLLQLSGPLQAQGEGEKPTSKPTETTQEKKKPEKKETPLDLLLKANEKGLPKALAAYIQHQIASNSLYAGQYDPLKKVKVEGVAKLLQAWIKEAPAEILGAAVFRRACLRALRDFYGKTAPEDLLKDLRTLAGGQYEAAAIKQSAMFALAQFGDRTFVDKILKRYEALTTQTDAKQQAQGHQGLADIYYQAGEYEKAVKAYKNLLGLHDAGKVQLPGVNTHLYNACCSMALAGKTDEAFEYLGRALKESQNFSRRMLEEDLDISSLRKDERFKKLLASYFSTWEEKKETKKEAKKEEGETKKDGGR